MQRSPVIQSAALWLFALCLAVLGLALKPGEASAAPAAPVDFPITQPDGTVFTARQWGDEWQNGLETAQGYTIVQDAASGFWVYAEARLDGSLAPALSLDGQVVAADGPPPPGLGQHARPALAPLQAPQLSPTFEESILPAQALGSHPLLVLLVEFNNRPHTYDANIFTGQFFGENRSVRAFYRDASYGKFAITPASDTFGANDGVIGWLPLSMAHPDDINRGPELVAAALAAADPYVNYRAYDTNADGYISNTELHLVVVAAGYESAYAPISPGMWAHRWWLDAAGIDPVLDGVHLGQSPRNGGYALFGEIQGAGDMADHAATIGVMVHELGHDLDWPDLYDISGDSLGVGDWSLMGHGSWLTTGYLPPGTSPALPDAFLRWYQRWVTPSPLASGQKISMRDTSSGQVLLVGSNPNGIDWDFYGHTGVGEYWLVENRQNIGFDAGLPGCGLLIWHINESAPADNYANDNQARPLVQLEQADGLRHLYYRANHGDSSDPYPGRSGNYRFGPTTNPASRYYNGTASQFDLKIETGMCGQAMELSYAYTANPPASRIYFPQFLYQQVYSGTVTFDGVPLSGIRIQLQSSTDWGLNWQLASATQTGPDGAYRFQGLSAPGGGRMMRVVYENPGDARYLYYWRCSPITGNWATDRYTCNINLRDVQMTSPYSGEPVSFPRVFAWQPRATADDSYMVELWEQVSAGGASWFSLVKSTYPLGYTGQSTLPATPLLAGHTYLWGLRVTNDSGHGLSFFLNPLSIADLTTALPAQQLPRE